MSATVLVIGPGTVTGPHPVPDELVAAAIEAIDDDRVLVGERAVTVADLWTDVIGAAVGDEHPRRLLLVCPGWWSDTRVQRLRRAAVPHCAHTAILRRHEVCGSAARCVIEIAAEFVLCRCAGAPVAATPRLGTSAEVAGSVARGAIGCAPIVIDAPTGVPGSAELASALAELLGARDVRMVDDAALAVSADTQQRPAPTPVRRSTVWACSAGLVLTLAATLVLPRVSAPAGYPTTLLTEGRVTVRIPVGWEARRVTGGPGSPRVEVTAPGENVAAPGGDAAAILLTQSMGGPDLASTAAVLVAALRVQPAGVFSALRTDDHRGGRAVLSYTETRADHEIAWAVFLDGRVRIAIGCRQPPTGVVIRRHCDEAIRSAHAAP
ncbi:type VII secretion-associated protein [Mycobacterium sp. MBM]|nr:type VII secretion-associated protein [Mycobacterium sp. MBM]